MSFMTPLLTKKTPVEHRLITTVEILGLDVREEDYAKEGDLLPQGPRGLLKQNYGNFLLVSISSGIIRFIRQIDTHVPIDSLIL
jgi:hypothetical protein